MLNASATALAGDKMTTPLHATQRGGFSIISDNSFDNKIVSKTANKRYISLSRNGIILQ